ncbi:MAG TPA: DUF1549 domain-containing protein, partial [Candidatus Binatia bacterium]|nr:DUF1549 domain-containing protein [Candidatus Binatia bacterium]
MNRFRNQLVVIAGVVCAFVVSTPVASWSAEAKKADATLPKELPLPAIKELKVEPASLTLKDGRDERRVLVLGKTEAGRLVDLTSVATFKLDGTSLPLTPALSPKERESGGPSQSKSEVKVAATPTQTAGGVVEVKDGHIRAKAKGETTIVISAGGKEAKLAVKVEDAAMPAVRFVRDIEPVLSKVGCNAGTCHGSAKGKNGFKLSLRGYDPEFDYHALINDLSGRRFDRVNVDESLMLLKPTGDVPHEGRQVFKSDSREYGLIRQWIAEGAAYEEPAVGRAKSIEILPSEVEMDLPGRTQQLLVIAKYADGSVRDATREAVFESNNSDVAPIKLNTISALRRGEAAILVRYEGLYSARQVTVMGDRSGFEWVDVPEFNHIDKHVNAKLKRMKILPSEMCSDAEFVRRVYLDVTGLPPSGDVARAFINDKTDSRAKREKLVDQLIGSREFVKYWANKWADLLQCNSENLGQKGVWLFREWIEQCVSENKPYDKMVRELLTAEGSCYQNPAVNYLRVLREPGKITEDVSQTFLGVRFNCNKCHDHPFEKWTQNQYYQFGAYFAQVSIKRGFLG